MFPSIAKSGSDVFSSTNKYKQRQEKMKNEEIITIEFYCVIYTIITNCVNNVILPIWLVTYDRDASTNINKIINDDINNKILKKIKIFFVIIYWG